MRVNVVRVSVNVRLGVSVHGAVVEGKVENDGDVTVTTFDATTLLKVVKAPVLGVVSNKTVCDKRFCCVHKPQSKSIKYFIDISLFMIELFFGIR